MSSPKNSPTSRPRCHDQKTSKNHANKRKPKNSQYVAPNITNSTRFENSRTTPPIIAFKNHVAPIFDPDNDDISEHAIYIHLSTILMDYSDEPLTKGNLTRMYEITVMDILKRWFNTTGNRPVFSHLSVDEDHLLNNRQNEETDNNSAAQTTSLAGHNKRKNTESGSLPDELLSSQFKFEEKTQILNGSMDKIEQYLRYVSGHPSSIIRSFQKSHHDTVRFFFSLLLQADSVYISNFEGWYDCVLGSFVPEEIARDTQYKSPASGLDYVRRSHGIYYFRLTKYRSWVHQYVARIKDPKIRNKAKNMIDDVCAQDIIIANIVNNDLRRWASKVPGDRGHAIMIWYKTLCSHLTVTRYLEKFKSMGPNPDFSKGMLWNRDDIVLINDDYFEYYTIIWPAVLHSLNIQAPTNLVWVGRVESDLSGSSINNTSMPEISAHESRYFSEAGPLDDVLQRPRSGRDLDSHLKVENDIRSSIATSPSSNEFNPPVCFDSSTNPRAFDPDVLQPHFPSYATQHMALRNPSAYLSQCQYFSPPNVPPEFWSPSFPRNQLMTFQNQFNVHKMTANYLSSDYTMRTANSLQWPHNPLAPNMMQEYNQCLNYHQDTSLAGTHSNVPQHRVMPELPSIPTNSANRPSYPTKPAMPTIVSEVQLDNCSRQHPPTKEELLELGGPSVSSEGPNHASFDIYHVHKVYPSSCAIRFYFAQLTDPHTEVKVFNMQNFLSAGKNCLADCIGNLYNRVHGIARKLSGGQIPSISNIKYVEEEGNKLWPDGIKKLVQICNDAVLSVTLKTYADTLVQAAKGINKYLATAAPWTVEDTDRRDSMIRVAAEASLVLATLLEPICPEAGTRIWTEIFSSLGRLRVQDINMKWGRILPNKAINLFDMKRNLFPKCTSEYDGPKRGKRSKNRNRPEKSSEFMTSKSFDDVLNGPDRYRGGRVLESSDSVRSFPYSDTEGRGRLDRYGHQASFPTNLSINQFGRMTSNSSVPRFQSVGRTSSGKTTPSTPLPTLDNYRLQNCRLHKARSRNALAPKRITSIGCETGEPSPPIQHDISLTNFICQEQYDTTTFFHYIPLGAKSNFNDVDPNNSC